MKGLILVLLSQIILVSCKSFQAFSTNTKIASQCDSIVPQADVDWSKLQGDWFHLMFIPGFGNRFISCRKMEITNVNMTKKELDLNFNTGTYKAFGKRAREDLIFYKWCEKPGIIQSAIKYDFRSKAPSKMQLRKKASMANHLKTSNASKFTVVGTDHANYIILSQCRRYGSPLFWISMKNVSIEGSVADEIRSKLLAVGVDASELVLSGESACLL